MTAARHQVILLPGSVLPAGSAYGALLETLGGRVEAVAKELDVYATDEPPPNYRLALEGQGIHAFDTDELDLEALRHFERPVYFALGGRSHPDYYAEMPKRLAHVFPDFTLETFPQRHHFDPPHRIEPDRVAQSLLALWERAEAWAKPCRGRGPSAGGQGRRASLSPPR